MTRLLDGLARGAGAAVLTALVAACAHQTGTVVLLPEQDGRDASVVVRQGDQEIVLAQPYAAVRQMTSGPRAYTSTPQDVDALFGAALAAQPSRPRKFTLYFKANGVELDDASKLIVDRIIAEIKTHRVPDIVVVGHTDRVGKDTDNDDLSLRRAKELRTKLIDGGLPAESIVTAGRGEREPAVDTADGVAEPQNRRVEIVVR